MTFPRYGMVHPVPDLLASKAGAAKTIPQSGHFSFLPLPARATAAIEYDDDEKGHQRDEADPECHKRDDKARDNTACSAHSAPSRPEGIHLLNE